MTDLARLLVVDDDPNVVRTLGAVLEREGYKVYTAGSPAEVDALTKKEQFDCAIVDLRLGKANGIDVVKKLRAKQPDCVSIILTGYASLESAVAAIRQDAYDYLFKPCDLDELKLTVKGALERGVMVRALREQFKQQRVLNTKLQAYVEEVQHSLDTFNSDLEKKVMELENLKDKLQDNTAPDNKGS
jgi:DNA-binding NtrC family response regulator